MDSTQNGLNLVWTQPRMDSTSNGTEHRKDLTLNGTQPRMDLTPNGTQPRMDLTPNGTQHRMDLTPNGTQTRIPLNFERDLFFSLILVKTYFIQGGGGVQTDVKSYQPRMEQLQLQ